MLMNSLTAKPRSSFQSLVDARREGRVSRSTVICAQGERAQSVYYLESGLIKLSRRMEDKRDFLVRLIGAGELFGERALMSGEFYDATAEVLRESVVHQFPVAEFRELCRQRPEIWQWLAEQTSRRAEETERRIQLVLSNLASVFDAPRGDESDVLVPLSQSELASLVGATRETTSTTLNTLERRGMLRLGRRNMTIVSLRALRSAVNDLSNHASVGA
jgi:CRP/FNR family cyclic AMP-dependent transcriptional regulator